jgi:hypothetical protein
MATQMAPGDLQWGNWQRHHMIAEICVTGVIAWSNDVAKQPWLGNGVYAENAPLAPELLFILLFNST